MLRRITAFVLGAAIIFLALYLGLAIRYWLGWPGWLRMGGAILFPVAMLALWFLPGQGRFVCRVGALLFIAVLMIAYVAKRPVDQTWAPLHTEDVVATSDGRLVTIANFSDAIHRVGEPSAPRWTTRTFDLSKLRTAELIMQPFGSVKAMAHVMLSFGFADGEHVVVSMEARRAGEGRFDPLAGFFRHDRIYPMIGSERDLIWLRLSKIPPDEMEIYPILRGPEEIRAYFERILAFANEVHAEPRFYSTLRESCMTTLINIAPEVFAPVKWYDLRRWIPGYSLSLFQQLGLVDGSVPAAELAKAHRIREGILSPSDFPTDAAWSAYLRHR